MASKTIQIMGSVTLYDIFEFRLPGPTEGNPFAEVSFSANFHTGDRTIAASGFYDGAGQYVVRWMPDAPGSWQFTTHSNRPELDGTTGAFECLPARAGVHGPLRVANTYHFAHADGTRHFSFGTTCYAWTHQAPELQEQTLRTLAQSPFNKIRMCVFPKSYTYNQNEPDLFPFEQAKAGEAGGFDFHRPNPAFWRSFEHRVGQLAELGIEADIILFHPYDRWGFSKMGAENDDHYLRYALARLSAYRNVWWSLANEYDVNFSKSAEDWERIFALIMKHDPYGRLCSIHNWIQLDEHSTRTFYDFTKPAVTHCSIQHAHADLTGEWRERYQKPVIIDEACYEGNIPDGWGNLPGQEMTHRFWEAAVRGGYCGHGETYLDPNDILWWSKGGILKGQSPARIAFLRQVLEQMPEGWIDPLGRLSNSCQASGGIAGRYLLHYFGRHQPASITFQLPEGEFEADVLDTWEMTVTPIPGVHRGSLRAYLPGKPYLAVRVVRVDESAGVFRA